MHSPTQALSVVILEVDGELACSSHARLDVWSRQVCQLQWSESQVCHFVMFHSLCQGKEKTNVSMLL